MEPSNGRSGPQPQARGTQYSGDSNSKRGRFGNLNFMSDSSLELPRDREKEDRVSARNGLVPAEAADIGGVDQIQGTNQRRNKFLSAKNARHNNPSSESNSSNNSNNNESISSANNSGFSHIHHNTSSLSSTTHANNQHNNYMQSVAGGKGRLTYGHGGQDELGERVSESQLHDSESRLYGQEFLPICDALFNVISLAAYFCDIVFDVLTAYTFYTEELYEWSILAMVFITVSTVLSQVLSIKWYKLNDKRGQEAPCSTNVLLAMHLSLCGVLWRYFKLFIPVDLRFVKNEVRDLCLLRLVHAFCEAAPMLLIQLYLIWLKPTPDETTKMNVVSTALSLFNVCWALASFSKNIRRQNVHKLVLTWLGVIFQFLWRLGTVTSRVTALSVYATIYTYWVFLVIILHWFSMLMWLISPKNIFHGEKMSTAKKVWYSTLIALVYVFCYINVQETNSRQKLIIFYVTMFLENTLLFGVWLIAARYENYWFRELATSLVFAGFLVGIAFMLLYYSYFHVKKLSYAYETGTSSTYRESRGSSIVNGNYYSSAGMGKFSCGKGIETRGEMYGGSSGNGLSINFPRESRLGSNRHGGGGGGGSGSESVRNENLNSLPVGTNNEKSGRTAVYNKINGHHIHHPNVPGVFNCRFHPAMKRKKKKPTSFVPPPAVPSSNKAGANGANPNPNNNTRTTESFISPNNKTHPMMMNLVGANGKMNNPFWKRPLSITLGSENEGSVGSRVDIQQKLHEKKQQQLAELREIEEEIKQGKLKRPHISEIPEPVSERQPIPFEKKQPWFRADPPVQLSPRPPIIIPSSSDLNELVLDPTYLMYSAVGAGAFYEQPEWNYYEPLYQNDVETTMIHGRQPMSGLRKGHHPNSRDSIYKSYRIPSDIDSQMSLPRSYTLPREFKYRRKLRKPVKTEHFLPSTNSSDGDVDSGEDDPEIYSHLRPYPLPLPSIHHVHMPNSGQGKRYTGSRRHRLHETKL